MPPTRRMRIRFSLLTLLIFSLLAGGVWLFVLRYRGGPWKRTVLLKDYSGTVLLAADGSQFAAKANNQEIAIVRVRDGMRRVLNGSAPDFLLKLSDDGGLLISIEEKSLQIHAWDTATLSQKKQLQLNGIHDAPYSRRTTVFASDGGLLATLSGVWTMSIFDTKIETLIRTIETGSATSSIVFSHDKKWIAHGRLSVKVSPAGEECVVVWNLETGEKVKELNEVATFIDPLVFSPRDDYLLIGTSTAEKSGPNIDAMRIVSTHDFKKIAQLDGIVDADSRSFSPDGRHLVWADLAGVVSFDLSSGSQTRKTGEHRFRASFAPNGTRVLSARGKLYRFDTGLLLKNLGNVLEARFLDDRTVVTEELEPGYVIGLASGPLLVCRWDRHYPEDWWGFICLWEFWLMILFACASLWSIVRDRRILRANA